MKVNVVLYHPEIPQNTGNIMRTCAGTDTKLHLIEPLGFSLDEKNIKRSGAGYIDKTEYEIYSDYDDFQFKNEGTYFFITRYGKKTYSDIDFTKHDNVYFIFGSESNGIDNTILKPNIEHCLRVPMNDKIRSLNLANTVALVLYECMRQNDFNNLLKLEPFKGENYIIDN